MDIPLDTKGYVYDEIRRVLQFVRPNSKSSIDFSFSDVFATTKRIVFGGKDIPELLNVMLSTSLMSQVAQGLWYSSLFLDTKLSLELASLYLAYEASDTNIRLSNSDQFLQKVKSCLPSQVVSKLPKDLIDSCFELYQSNARMQKEIIMRTYLNTALSRNDVHAMLHYGMLVNDNQSCILALSLGGVSITRILDMTLVVSIPINLLIYCEETEGIVNLYSITDGVQKGVLNCCPLIVHSIRTASSLTILDYLDKLVSPREETINVLRRIINIADSGAECSIIKARSALIDNDIVRPLTLDEETQYNTFIESQANIEKLRSGTQSGLRNVFAFSLRSKRTLDTLKSSVDSIPREKSDLLTSILTPLSYMWINYPLELKRPLSTGRVPATWSVEAWNSLVSLKKVQLEWLGVLKEFFLKMCFGAPQPYVDELYLILAKLTNGAYVNSNITTNVYIYRLWTAFALIIHYFGPSPLVYDYVHAHVRSALKLYLSKKEPRLSRLILAVNHCRKNLLSTPVIPRKRVPSSVELDYCITLFHVAIGLRLFNPNEVMVVEIKPLTTLNKLSQIVMNRIGMREAPSASYAIYKKSDQGLFMPDKNSYVFDVLDIKDRTPDDTSSDTEVFVIRRVLELRNISSIVSMDEKYNYVRQIISDINCDYLPIPATLNFAKIAAYLLQYEYGDYNINTTISIYEKICESYIPLSLRDKREVTPHNIREWHMALTRVSKGAAVVELATMLSRWKLHNAVIFDVEQEHDISANKKCKLALIPGEILIDPSPDGQRYASRIPLSAVTGVFDHEDNTIIVYDSDTGVTRVIFSTRRHSELSYFVNVFCGST